MHEWHKRVALHQGRPREVRDGPTSRACLRPALLQGPPPSHQFPAQPDSALPAQIINTYTEAVQTVDPFKATGKPHTLWVAFAKFYEDNGQLDDVSMGVAYGRLMGSLPRPLVGVVSAWPLPAPQARVILEKATKVSFKQVDDLASVWCECGELELRHENYDQALRLLRVSIGGQGVG